MVKKPSQVKLEKTYVLVDKWNDPVCQGGLSEIASFIASDEDCADEDYINGFTLYELGPQVKFKYIPSKIVL